MECEVERKEGEEGRQMEINGPYKSNSVNRRQRRYRAGEGNRCLVWVHQ